MKEGDGQAAMMDITYSLNQRTTLLPNNINYNSLNHNTFYVH